LIKLAIDGEHGGLENFQNHMRHPGRYADGNMASIVALMFDVNLHVHTADGVLVTNPDEPDASGKRRPVLNVSFIGAHWEATRPLSHGIVA
jgi:hypothetical protein